MWDTLVLAAKANFAARLPDEKLSARRTLLDAVQLGSVIVFVIGHFAIPAPPSRDTSRRATRSSAGPQGLRAQSTAWR
jgi:hypothetical protein